MFRVLRLRAREGFFVRQTTRRNSSGSEPALAFTRETWHRLVYAQEVRVLNLNR